MDHNQILLDAVIEFPSQLLVESSDGPQEGSLLLSPANQLPISNQNMVEMGKQLLEAASENNLESVKSLMTGGAPFTGNWLGTTPLHAAAKAGHIETVELLLKAGIFRDAKTKVERTALQMAAEEGFTAIVQMLLEHGADINAKDMLKMTALHWAVERGHRDCVTVLLSYGADVNVFNKFEKTPMEIASDNGFEDIALQLETAAFQKTNQSQNLTSTGKTESASQNSTQDLLKSPSWKTSPEEDALEKLTANAHTSESTSHEALKLLESHGISFLPVDNSTLLTSALESGQSIGLTEAGKMALNHLKKDTTSPLLKPSPSQPIANTPKSSLPRSTGHPRVVTITAEQFLALAGRLKQQGKTNGNGKPMIISLPKNLTLKGMKAKIDKPAVVSPVKSPHLNPQLSEFVLGQEVFSNPAVNGINQVQASAVPLSMPILIEEEPCSTTTSVSVNTTNDERIQHSSELDSVPPQTVSPLPADISSEVTSEMIKPTYVGTATSVPIVTLKDARKEHFFKSGLLKGSARTTPMTVLCRLKKRKSPCDERNVILEECPAEPAMVELHSKPTPLHQPTLNNAAPPLDADDDDMFGNEESQSRNANHQTPVWLSIMEEENSQFSAGTGENDDDLLDPSRLAAQLASIRQAASQYSFSS